MKTIKPYILVIDDEPQIRTFLRVSFEAHQYEYLCASTGTEGIKLAAAKNPDLIILDLGLPDLDGQDVLIKLREWFSNPIIILSVRSDDESIVQALEREATDYVRKPFSISELLARTKNAINHCKKLDSQSKLDFGHLSIDLSARRAFIGDNDVKLSGTEYELLKLFANNAGKVLTHSHILKSIWGQSSIEHRQYLRVYVSHLRQKIEMDRGNPQLIINEPGVGYRFADLL